MYLDKLRSMTSLQKCFFFYQRAREMGGIMGGDGAGAGFTAVWWIWPSEVSKWAISHSFSSMACFWLFIHRLRIKKNTI